MNNHNKQKKIAVINTFAGFGRCSLAVSIPIISHMKIQTCPVPTAVFSNNTAFDSFYYKDFSDSLTPYINEWRKLNLKFETILSGYLSSPSQIKMVSEFVKEFLKPEGLFILDPIMGDNGRIYSAYKGEMCNMMKELTGLADVITPNLTEACILTGHDYATLISKPTRERNKIIDEIGHILLSMMKKEAAGIVISGISSGNYLLNYICNPDGTSSFLRKKKVGHERCGTGDVFASVIAGALTNGYSLSDSVKKAASFVKECITISEKMEIPLTDGVCFEEVLFKL